MRKVLSFVLVLSLVLGSFGMAFAAAPASPSDKSLSDIGGLKCEDAVRVLTSLDVVSGYADGTYKPDQSVTRAEMATLIIKSLGLKETNAVPKFKDSQNHWAKGYIAYANTLGIISGRTATTFDPDATVTYDEATTMLVKALGYTDAALVGTYPASFVSRAKVLGILDGIQTGNGGANRGDMAIMLYQTLDQAIGKVDADGNFQATVIEWNKADGNATSAKKYDTMLDRLGAEMYRPSGGFVNDNDESFVLTGNEDAVINLTPYVGALVSAYKNSDDDIIAIKQVFSTFVSGTIKDDTVKLADGTEYTLKSDAINDLTTAEKFENGDNVVTSKFNGSANADLTNRNEAANFTLAVDLSGKKINEVYSVAFWNVSSADVLEADDLNDITKNHKLLGVDFDEDNNNDIDATTFELIGAKTLDDIKADMVAYVYKNKDNNIARVAVGPIERVTGEASAVNSSGKKVTVTGKDYKFAKEELKGNGAPGQVGANDVKAGDEVKLAMDAYGYIYDAEAIGDSKYAIVLRMEDNTSDRVNSDAQLKLMLADGSNKIFTANADDINDAVIVDSKGVWNQKVVTTGALLKYNLDKNGEINDLIAATAPAIGANEAMDKDLKMYHSGKASITSKGYYDGKEIAKDAVLFNYEGDVTKFAIGAAMSNKADDYSVATYEKILDMDDVESYYVYDTNTKKIVAMLMNDATSSSDVFGVVVSKGTNNSDAGAYYNMLIDGKSVKANGTDSGTVSADNNATSIAAVKLDVNNSGSSELHRVKYDSAGDVKQFDYWNNGKDDVHRAEVAVTAGNKDSIKMDNRTFTAPANTIDNYYYNATTAAVAATHPTSLTIDKDAIVYRYDKVADEWQVGSTSDLRSLKADTKLRFYDVADEDGVYDIIMIDESNTASNSNPGNGGNTTGTDVTLINSTGTKIIVGDSTYTIDGDTVLVNKVLGTKYIGSTDLKTNLALGDKIEVKAKNGLATEVTIVWDKSETATLTTATGTAGTAAVKSFATGTVDTNKTVTLAAVSAGTAGDGYTLAITTTTGALSVEIAGKAITVEATTSDTLEAIANAVNAKSDKVKLLVNDADKSVANITLSTITTANGVDLVKGTIVLTFDKAVKADAPARVNGISGTPALTTNDTVVTITADKEIVVPSGVVKIESTIKDLNGDPVTGGAISFT